MSSSTIVSRLILLFFICRFSIGYDIIIYTATPSGIAAAITAARTSPTLSVVSIEPTPYVGGMVSAGGIGLRDTMFVDVRKFCSHFLIFHRIPSYN
jgi:ribulose 1,5-bisphosphate synthetase/thiazole synthase